MIQLVEANWMAIVVALVVGLLVAYWVFARGGKPAERPHRPDVLDEGAAPARRNQALIDAPPAAVAATMVVTPPAAELLGGIGEVIAAAVQHEVSAAAKAKIPEIAKKPVDDLTRIKGVGPKLSTLLVSLGVTSYAQIAAWTDADLARIDGQLGSFVGRPARDQWVEQAKLFVTGDTGGYESKFGKL